MIANKCLACGSSKMRADRALSGRLVCISCGTPLGVGRRGSKKIRNPNTFSINNMFRIADVEADFAISNVMGCDSMLVSFQDLSSSPSVVKWDFGDGGSSIQNNPQHHQIQEFLQYYL